MQTIKNEQAKYLRKHCRKIIKDIFSGRYPYVPPKPEHEPKLNDYGLTENLIKQNKFKKKAKI